VDQNQSIIDVLESSTMSIEDLFVDCSFERENINCSEIITKVFDANFGQCYVIDVKQTQVNCFTLFFQLKSYEIIIRPVVLV